MVIDPVAIAVEFLCLFALMVLLCCTMTKSSLRQSSRPIFGSFFEKPSTKKVGKTTAKVTKAPITVTIPDTADKIRLRILIIIGETFVVILLMTLYLAMTGSVDLHIYA